MPDEARPKTFFGNDMTDEQWAEHCKTMVAAGRRPVERTVERLSGPGTHHLRQHDR
jgi:hypothetical protein